MHLPREPDGGDPRLRRGGREVAQDLARGRPPRLRVLLGPAGPRGEERVGEAAARQHAPVLGDQHALGAGGPDVDPDRGNGARHPSASPGVPAARPRPRTMGRGRPTPAPASRGAGHRHGGPRLTIGARRPGSARASVACRPATALPARARTPPRRRAPGRGRRRCRSAPGRRPAPASPRGPRPAAGPSPRRSARSRRPSR